MKILVTYAVQGEFTELKFPGLIGEEEVHIGYIRTGVGKVKSAYYVSEVLNQAKPDLVINVGTAGSIDCQVGDILVCRHFIDRDMQKLANMRLILLPCWQRRDIVRIGREKAFVIQVIRF